MTHLIEARRLHQSALDAHRDAADKLAQADQRITTTQERMDAITQARIAGDESAALVNQFGALNADLLALQRLKSGLESDRDGAWALVSKAADELRLAEQQHAQEVDNALSDQLRQRAAKLDAALCQAVAELCRINAPHGRPSPSSNYQFSRPLRELIAGHRV